MRFDMDSFAGFMLNDELPRQQREQYDHYTQKDIDEIVNRRRGVHTEFTHSYFNGITFSVPWGSACHLNDCLLEDCKFMDGGGKLIIDGKRVV